MLLKRDFDFAVLVTDKAVDLWGSSNF